MFLIVTATNSHMKVSLSQESALISNVKVRHWYVHYVSKNNIMDMKLCLWNSFWKSFMVLKPKKQRTILNQTIQFTMLRNWMKLDNLMWRALISFKDKWITHWKDSNKKETDTLMKQPADCCCSFSSRILLKFWTRKHWIKLKLRNSFQISFTILMSKKSLFSKTNWVLWLIVLIKSKRNWLFHCQS